MGLVRYIWNLDTPTQNVYVLESLVEGSFVGIWGTS